MSNTPPVPKTDETGGLPTRADKTIAWLRQSRDTWKQKSTQAKYDRKIFKFGKTRLEGQRDALQEQASKMQDQIQSLQQQLEDRTHKMTELEEQLKKKDAELKKKFSLQ